MVLLAAFCWIIAYVFYLNSCYHDIFVDRLKSCTLGFLWMSIIFMSALFVVIERQRGVHFVIQALLLVWKLKAAYLSGRWSITFNRLVYLVALYAANPNEFPSALRFWDSILWHIWLLYMLQIQQDCVHIQEYFGSYFRFLLLIVWNVNQMQQK